MKAVVVSAHGQMDILEIPIPQCGPYDCLVKIDACAICTGTDSSIVYKNFPWRAAYPFVLGHESTGIILELGPKVKYFKPGQRVTRPAAVLNGERVAGLGSTWGGYAEYGLVRDTRSEVEDGLLPDGMLNSSRNPLPEDVDPVSAALSINQREILSVVQRIPLDPAARVIVIGSGYNGLLFAWFCKHYGAGQVVMTGSARMEKRAKESFHVDHYVDYRQADVVQQVMARFTGAPSHMFDAVGSKSSLALARQILRPMTAFGCYGVDDFLETEDQRKALARSQPQLDTSTVEADFVADWYNLWEKGRFNVPGMLDDVMPMDQIHLAFDRLARREAVKIVLRM